MIQAALPRRDDGERFAASPIHDNVLTGGMRGHALDVFHQVIDLGKDLGVDPLADDVRGLGPGRQAHRKGVVDVPRAVRCRRGEGAGQFKMTANPTKREGVRIGSHGSAGGRSGNAGIRPGHVQAKSSWDWSGGRAIRCFQPAGRPSFFTHEFTR